ncbi:MAG TPA: ankyrin repeat domain-containing protein [Rhodanobacteraceae bacterium]|nr:ankyrin repeat domain-containing protein [Rhodanobacteraceae bacterium]
MVDRTVHEAAKAGDAALLREILPYVSREDIDATDDLDLTPLAYAVSAGHADVIAVLLEAGADVEREYGFGRRALHAAPTRAIARQLIEAGASLHRLPHGARRAIVGYPEHSSIDLLTASEPEFRSGWRRRFGTQNPEAMDDPFWIAMIRSGVGAWEAGEFFRRCSGEEPVWCADRFGQSITLLPDGRIVEIAGEHEDFYDPDFCIYNDVFVHEPGGDVHVYGYPEDVFPPTDFHTATLLGDTIWLIGSLGYLGTREYGRTPVFALDTKSLRIERIETKGEAPGWIFKHHAEAISTDAIRITDCEIARDENGKEVHARNDRAFVLDVRRRMWTSAPGRG